MGFFYALVSLEISLLLEFFLSILSKHVEHNKCPFLLQKVLVDLSIFFLQIRHLKIGTILVIKLAILVTNNLTQISYLKFMYLENINSK